MDCRVIDEFQWAEFVAAWPGDKDVLVGLHLQPASDLVAAHIDGTPVGYGVIQWGGPVSPNARAAFPGSVELNHLWIVESARGQGAGSRIIGLAEQEAVRRGFGQMVVRVGEENAGARRLYERLGYHATGVWDTTTYSFRDSDGKQVEATERDEVLVKTLWV